MLSLLIAMLWLFVVSVSQQTRSELISADEINSAIAFGSARDVSPYPLKSIYPQAKEPAALVYTPFVRIAQKAREASVARRPYGITDVDAETGSALIHIVMSADALVPVKGLTEDDAVSMAVVQRADQRLLFSSEADMAEWVAEGRDRTEVGLRRSRFNGVVIGAFARDQLCEGCFVVAFRMKRTPGGHRQIQSVWARIDPSDVTAWR